MATRGGSEATSEGGSAASRRALVNRNEYNFRQVGTNHYVINIKHKYVSANRKLTYVKLTDHNKYDT